MQAGAVLVVGDPCEGYQNEKRSVIYQPTSSAMMCVHILGQSILSRTVEQLQAAGVHPIDIANTQPIVDPAISDHKGVSLTPPLTRDMTPWMLGARLIAKQAAQGIKAVLAITLNAYAEFDFYDLLRYHIGMNQPLTRVFDGQESLPAFVVKPGMFAEAVLSPLLDPEKTNWTGLPLSSYPLGNYVKRVRGAQDMRDLVKDAFLGRCALKPRGQQTRPGVWIEASAAVHPKAHLVAPVYIGRQTRVGDNALITRSSAVEARCQVLRNAVIDDSSILADTYIGKGVEVAHSVVQGSTVVHLHRQVAVNIDDGNLIRSLSKQEALPSATSAVRRPSGLRLANEYSDLASETAET